MLVKITRIDESRSDIFLPKYATPGSAGMDIFADISEQLTINPGETRLIPTGFKMELPPGYEAQIRPRSGLAINNEVGILNSPGTIDSDYRGEIKIILKNFGKNNFIINKGDRIAQMVITSYIRIEWKEVNEINETERGSGGFGHTGK